MSPSYSRALSLSLKDFFIYINFSIKPKIPLKLLAIISNIYNYSKSLGCILKLGLIIGHYVVIGLVEVANHILMSQGAEEISRLFQHQMRDNFSSLQ